MEEKRVCKVEQLDNNDILPNRFQPRKYFDEEEILQLAESIKEHGVINPIIVRKLGDKFELVAGERRYKANILAGNDNIPAIIMDVNDKESSEIAVVENIQRKDLNPVEEAISYKRSLDIGYMTQEQLAHKMGKSQSYIANKIRLLKLSDEVQDALMKKEISERHARSLLKLNSLKQQNELLKRIINERLTVRKTDEEIEKMNNNINNSIGGTYNMNNDVFNNNLNSDVNSSLNVNNQDVFEMETNSFASPTSISNEDNINSQVEQLGNNNDILQNNSKLEPVVTESPILNDDRNFFNNNSINPTTQNNQIMDNFVMPQISPIVEEITPIQPVTQTPDINLGLYNDFDDNLYMGNNEQKNITNEIENLNSIQQAENISSLNLDQEMSEKTPELFNSFNQNVEMDSMSRNNLENNNSIDLQELSFDNQFSNVNESMKTEFDMNEINVPSVELDKEKNSLENGQLNNEKLSNSFENMYMGNNIGNDFNYKSNVSTDNFTTSINKEEPIFKSSPIIDTTQNYNLQTDLKNPLDLDKGISPDIEDKNNANDFYKPEVKPEPIIVNEYNQQYDPIMPDNNVKPSIDFKSILGLIRKCSAAIENSGYKIETEEYNLDNLYQVVFKIEKR